MPIGNFEKLSKKGVPTKMLGGATLISYFAILPLICVSLVTPLTIQSKANDNPPRRTSHNTTNELKNILFYSFITVKVFYNSYRTELLFHALSLTTPLTSFLLLLFRLSRDFGHFSLHMFCVVVCSEDIVSNFEAEQFGKLVFLWFGPAFFSFLLGFRSSDCYWELR